MTLYNVSYCNCSTPPCPSPCGYTFTQADINSGNVRIYGTSPGSDSFQFTLTDGMHVLENQTFTFQFYSPPSFSTSKVNLLWEDDYLVLSNISLGGFSAEAGVTPTYTFTEPLRAPAAIQKYDGVDWTDVPLDGNWTQGDVDSGNIRFYHPGTNISDYGTYTIPLAFSDGATVITVTPSIYVIGVITVSIRGQSISTFLLSQLITRMILFFTGGSCPNTPYRR